MRETKVLKSKRVICTPSVLKQENQMNQNNNNKLPSELCWKKEGCANEGSDIVSSILYSLQ